MADRISSRTDCKRAKMEDANSKCAETSNEADKYLRFSYFSDHSYENVYFKCEFRDDDVINDLLNVIYHDSDLEYSDSTLPCIELMLDCIRYPDNAETNYEEWLKYAHEDEIKVKKKRTCQFIDTIKRCYCPDVKFDVDTLMRTYPLPNEI